MADMVICPAKVPVYLPFMLFGFSLHYNTALYLHCAFNFKAIYPHNSSPGIGNKNQVVVVLFLWRRKLRLHHHISISFFQGCSLKRQEYRLWREISMMTICSQTRSFFFARLQRLLSDSKNLCQSSGHSLSADWGCRDREGASEADSMGADHGAHSPTNASCSWSLVLQHIFWFTLVKNPRVWRQVKPFQTYIVLHF